MQRPGAAANTVRSTAGCRCTPSAISSTSTGESSSAPTGPGSRWWSGRIALKRCVPRRAPASRAARDSSYVASVWPIAATTPASASWRTASIPPGSSGARVTMRTAPSPAARRAWTEAGSGWVSEPGWWAPERCGLSQGPSRWMPASRPSCTSRASSRTASAIRWGVSVTRLAAIDVVPWARWVSATTAAASAVPRSNDAPPPPCTWRSTKPGTTVASPRSTSGARGGAPSPTSTMRSPSRSSHPGARTRAGVTTCRAARITSGLVVLLEDRATAGRVVVVLATGRPEVPLPDHEPEQEVVERRVGQADRDDQQRLGGDVEVEDVVEQSRREAEAVLDADRS